MECAKRAILWNREQWRRQRGLGFSDNFNSHSDPLASGRLGGGNLDRSLDWSAADIRAAMAAKKLVLAAADGEAKALAASPT